MNRISRRGVLTHVLDEGTRTDLATFAAGAGVAADRAAGVADAAVVRVLRGGVPRDPAMVDALLRLEVRRLAAGGAVPGAKAADQAGASAGPAPRRALARRVRLARAGRLGLTCAAVVAACALVAGGALAVTRVDRAPAASAAEVPVDPPPAVVEEPTAPATPRALGPVSQAPGLPPAEPLLEGMLEAAGQGWALVQVEASEVEDAVFVYLMDPAGTLYEVPTPLGAQTWSGGLWIEDWLQGTSLVTASEPRSGDSVVVDLLTGQRFLTIPSRIEGFSAASRAVAFVGDGTTDVIASWTAYDGDDDRVGHTVRLGLDGVERDVVEHPFARGGYTEPLISDDRERLVLSDAAGPRIVGTADFDDAATVPLPYAPEDAECAATRWLGDDALLLSCVLNDGVYTNEAWIAPVSGGEPVRLAEGYGVTAWAAGDGIALGRATDVPSSRHEGDTWGMELHRCGWDGSCSEEPAAGIEGWMTTVGSDGTLYVYDAPYEGVVYGNAVRAADLETGQVRTLLEVGPDTSVIVVLPPGGGTGGTEWSSV